MKPDEPIDDGVAHAYRIAARTLDERPGRDVRSAVVAAATRRVGARAHDAAKPPNHRRRWPWSAAALVVVSVMTGLVARQTLQERPDVVTEAAPVATAPASASAASPAPVSTDSGPRPAVDLPKAASPAQVAAPRREPARRHDRAATVDRERPTGPAASPEAFAPPPPMQPLATAKMDVRRSAAIDRTPVADDAEVLEKASGAVETRARRGTPNAVEPLSAEAWVERIAVMRASGHDDEADHELAALRRRYPTFTVPPRALPANDTR